ncbi:MAG: hypothetical protein EXR95_08200 [Gemmatimonadetes bacterium]|nr:hypothetical protein [Gemmatimonadota bacterium]
MRVMVQGGPGGVGWGGPQPVSQEQIKQMRRQQIEEVRFYPEVPVLLDLATGWSGKIWGQRRGRNVNDPGQIDVVTHAGEYVGTLPETVKLPRAGGPNGLVAYVERDVPRVAIRRLPADLR